MVKQSTQIRPWNNIFDVSSTINKMIGHQFYIFQSSPIIIPVHSSTIITPFFAYCGQHPRWTFLELLPPSLVIPSTEERLSRIRQIQQEVSTHL
jgi:hypothetical protein